jgi:hypothetical protein
MSYFRLIPDDLILPSQKTAFLAWLTYMPISFNSRMHIYFAWLDYNSASYSADEIDSLRDQEVSPGSPQTN